MKKLIAAVLCLLMVVSVFASGSSESASKSGVQTIEVFTRFSDGATKNYFEEVANAFMAENPDIKVVLSSANNANYKQEINVRLASNSSPDIYFAWSGCYAGNFVEGGRALDLTPYLNADNASWYNSFITNQFGPFTFNGKIYGIPLMMDGKAFYYNKDIFTELGLTAPENWDEFMVVLETLKNSKYIPISLGNIEDWATGHYMTTLNQRVVPADVLAADYALEGDFTAPEYVEALNYLEKLVPYFTPEFNSVTYDGGINDFLSGKAAIYYEQFNQVQYIAPATFEWSWFDFPDIIGAAGDQNALTGAPQGLMVSSSTKYPEACVKFLQYLTNLENGSKLVKEAMMFSCVDGAITTETATEKMALMAETIKAASSVNLWLDNATDSEVCAVYLSGIQAMVGGDMTAEEVMKAVQQKAAQVKADK
ncbi:MAG: ABC transporter substrate-binding protein [Candidatus Ornithospirochaeta sp.]